MVQGASGGHGHAQVSDCLKSPRTLQCCTGVTSRVRCPPGPSLAKKVAAASGGYLIGGAWPGMLGSTGLECPNRVRCDAPLAARRCKPHSTSVTLHASTIHEAQEAQEAPGSPRKLQKHPTPGTLAPTPARGRSGPAAAAAAAAAGLSSSPPA